MMVSVTDEPINRENPIDALGIGQHANSLAEFVADTEMPLTIGIQGEWGSGKTSLLNTMHKNLSENDKIKQIWINAWENSLLSSPEETLIKIIGQIIDEMVEADDPTKSREKIKTITKTVFSGALRIGAAAALGAKGGAVADELLDKQANSIKELRESLIDLIKKIRERESNPYNRIVIYVDDLDRMIPEEAVRILELMKNIFSVPGCVFILAIDYQVIVKGLEGKFGPQTAKNEWEFRAFFDKIIQLPYMMPMGQYNVGDYVNKLLQDIGYEVDEDNSEHLESIVKNTIGGNPRSIIRLVNSVALINLFSKSQTNIEKPKELDKNTDSILLFSLVCIQIAYPDIYDLLLQQPNFPNWDSDIYTSVISSSNIEVDEDKLEKDFNVASKTEDFNEEWEKILFKICYRKPRYRAKSINISRVLSTIKDDLIKDEKNVGLFIQHAHNITSVTNVTSTDSSHAGREFKDAKWKSAAAKQRTSNMWKLINSRLPALQIYKIREASGTGIVRNKVKTHPICVLTMSVDANFSLRICDGEIADNLKLFDLLYGQKEWIVLQLSERLGEGIELDWQRKEKAKRQEIRLISDLQESVWAKAGGLLSDEETLIEEYKNEFVDVISQIAPIFEEVILEALDKVSPTNAI